MNTKKHPTWIDVGLRGNVLFLYYNTRRGWIVYKIQSETHLFNVTKKELKSRGMELLQSEIGELERLCKDFMNMEQVDCLMDPISQYNLHAPISSFTYRLYNDSYRSTRELVDTLHAMNSEYHGIAVNYKNGHHKDILKGLSYCIKDNGYFVPEHKLESLFVGSRKEFQEDMKSLWNVPGVYFLYNKNKKLVYVGKSVNLKDRIVGSILERKAFYYEYAITNTKSDVAVYEAYYISKLKPNLNVDGKYSDNLTIELKCIRNGRVKSVYKEVPV